MHSYAKKTIAIALLIAPVTLLGVVGVIFVVSPPRSRSDFLWLSVAPISRIPADGQPALLPIIAPRHDAWMRLRDEIVGQVFARRDLATNEIQVISWLHGPLSVPVDFDPRSGGFISRCFDVRFDINGTVIPNGHGNSSPADGMHAVDFTVIDNVLFVRNTER